MKTTIKSITTSVFIACMSVFGSCSGTHQPSVNEVCVKVNNGDQLETADYEVMLDYLEEFVEVGEASTNDYESGQEVARQFPYFMQFAGKLDNAPSEIKNSERYRDISSRFAILMNR